MLPNFMNHYAKGVQQDNHIDKRSIGSLSEVEPKENLYHFLWQIVLALTPFLLIRNVGHSSSVTLRVKSEVPSLLIGLLRRLNVEFPHTVHRLRTDNGTEFSNRVMSNFCHAQGIFHEFSVPYIHEMMGRAENVNRLTLEAMRAVLRTANLSNAYWSYAGACITVVANMIKKTSDKRSPQLTNFAFLEYMDMRTFHEKHDINLLRRQLV